MHLLAVRCVGFQRPWALLLAIAVIGAVASSSPAARAAAASEPAPVLLRGDGDSYMDVDLSDAIRLGPVTEFPAGASGGEQVTSTSLGTT